MAKGDGSIYELGRNKWRVSVDFGRNPVTKKRERVTRVINGSKAEARKVRDRMRKEHESGLSIDAQAALTGDYLVQWIENRKAANDLAHATISNYERYMRVWIAPYLGKITLKDLKPYTVESWHRKAREDGASPRTLQAAHKVLKQALKDAMRYELILSNPCDMVKTPKAEAKKRGYLVPEEARRMLEVLDGMGDTAFTLAVRLGLATGARRGEVLGLTWKHVDIANATISIVQSLAQVDGAKKEGCKAKELKSPKTESGKRRVSLDSETMKRMANWKSLQAMELYKAGIKQTQDTPVCVSLYDAKIGGVSPFLGGYLDPQKFSSQFAAFCDQHAFFSTTGKRLCFHELRHTQATLLLSNGEDIISVAGRLGHASPSITSDMYAHAMPEKDRECAEVMGKLFAKPKMAAILSLKTA